MLDVLVLLSKEILSALMARDNDREIEAFMPKTGIGQKVNSTL